MRNYIECFFAYLEINGSIETTGFFGDASGAQSLVASAQGDIGGGLVETGHGPFQIWVELGNKANVLNILQRNGPDFATVVGSRGSIGWEVSYSNPRDTGINSQTEQKGFSGTGTKPGPKGNLKVSEALYLALLYQSLLAERLYTQANAVIRILWKLNQGTITPKQANEMVFALHLPIF